MPTPYVEDERLRAMRQPRLEAGHSGGKLASNIQIISENVEVNLPGKLIIIRYFHPLMLKVNKVQEKITSIA